MNKRILILTLAFVCSTVFVCSTAAFAQVATPSTTLHHREWEGSFFAGYTFHQDYKFRTVVTDSDGGSPGVVEMHYEPGYRIGGRATQNFAEYFSATMEYGLTSQTMRLTNVVKRVPNLVMGHFVHSLTYNVAFSPMPRDRRFRPHIELGTGALLFHISKDSKEEATFRNDDAIPKDDSRFQDLNLEDSWEVVFNYGVGFKYLVADRFALVVDARGRVSDVPTYGLPKFSRSVNGQFTPAISARGLMNAWQFNIGIAHQWDEW